MGMYTELNLNVELKKDTPKNIICILKYMLDTDLPQPILPNHELFSAERWDWMLRCDSYYFDADTHSTLRKDFQGGNYLNIQCNLKNYSSEIEHFINWITPYVDTDGYWGHLRYEEAMLPTIIVNGKLYNIIIKEASLGQTSNT